jgi:alkanesulfonate monooxygenase SsuD/methylene tetrahydromethanopterin reductase-like flavin-dependent oxidoreductase (luciferase family)
VRGAVYCWGAVDADGAVARRRVIDVVSGVYQQDFTPLADRYLLHGSPKRVIERLREYHDAGAREVVFTAAAGSAEEGERMLRLFADEVLGEIHGWA